MPGQPAERRTVTVTTMRTINRTAVLDMIRLYSPISRTRIAHLLHASLPTIMRSVDDLLGTDLVRLTTNGAFDPAFHPPVLTNTAGNSISIFDKQYRQVVGVIATGKEPRGLVFDQQRKRVVLVFEGAKHDAAHPIE